MVANHKILLAIVTSVHTRSTPDDLIVCVTQGLIWPQAIWYMTDESLITAEGMEGALVEAMATDGAMVGDPL